MPADDDDLRSVAELTNQATHLRRAGRTAEAVATFRAAMARADENGEPMLRAMVRVNAGTAFADVGDRAAETRAYEEALEILGPDAEPSPVLLLGTTNLGGARAAEGRLDEAQRHLAAAFDLAGRLGERAQQGVAIGHLGRVALARGRLATAFDHLETAIAVADEERDLPSLQYFQNDLADAYTWLGLHREGLGAYSVARDISVASGDTFAEARCLHGLGLNELLDGDDRAYGTLEAALSAFVRIGDLRSARDVALTLARGWTGHAAGLAERGLTGQFLRDGVLPAGARIVDQAGLTTAAQWLRAAEEFAAQDGADHTSDAILALDRHAVLLLGGDVEGAERVLTAAVPDAPDGATRAALEHALGALLALHRDRPIDALAHFDAALGLRTAGPGTPDPGTPGGRLRDDGAPLAMRAAAAAAAAGDTARAFGYAERVTGGTAGAAAVTAALTTAPGTALVELLPGTDATLAFAFLPGGTEPRVLTLAAGLAAAEQAWWAPLSEARAVLYAGGEPPAWEASVSAVLADLGQFLAPVASVLAEAGAEHVVLVPHGLLHAFPLHAAELPGGGTWLEAVVVSYATSAAAAVSSFGSAAPEPADLSAVGDPTGDLPLAGVEAARAIARAARRGAFLAGPDVAADDLVSVLGPRRWLHWAGHARHVLDDPSSSGFLHGRPGEDGEARLLAVPDGRPLTGSTVVLSACETAVVTPHVAGPGGGLVGDLLRAGAAAVVATSWEVGEVCAVLVVDRFYAALAAGAPSVAHALRTAQLAVRDLPEDVVHDELAAALEESTADAATRWGMLAPFRLRRTDVAPYAHPEAWAAFAVTGSGATPPLLGR